MHRLLPLLFIALTACSTTDPAEICTAEWIQPRADKAVQRIERKARTALDAFGDAAQVWLSGGSPDPLQMWKLSNAAKSLEAELTDGPGIRDLRTLATTCDDTELVRDRLLTLLEDNRVPGPVLSTLDQLGILDRLLDVATGPENPTGPGNSTIR